MKNTLKLGHYDFFKTPIIDGNSVSILYEKERKIKQKKSKNLKGLSISEDKDYDVSNLNLNDFESISAYDPDFRNMCVGTNSYEKLKK